MLKREIKLIFYTIFLLLILLISEITLSAMSKSPIFSNDGGFYKSSFDLMITGNPGELVRYTLDGSEPTNSSPVFTEPIRIDSTFYPLETDSPMSSGANVDAQNYYNGMVVKAKSFLPNGEVTSETITHSYFVNPNGADMFANRIISMTVEPSRFIGSSGMYTQWFDSLEETFRPTVFLEFYGPDGSLMFKQKAQAQISGHATKADRKKSIRFNFNKGDGVVHNMPELIPNVVQNFYSRGSVGTFKKITARTSNWTGSTINETLTHKIAKVLRPEIMDVTYSALFVNGEFWSMYEVREQTDDVFIAAHYTGLPAKDVIMLSFDWTTNNDGTYTLGHPFHPFTINNKLPVNTHPLYKVSLDEGKNEAQSYSMFMAMYDAITKKNLSDPTNFERVKELVDIDNMIDFFLTYIHMSSSDWPGNNFRAWVSSKKIPGIYGADMKWRFILNDFDISMGSVNNNRLLYYTTEGGIPDDMGGGDNPRRTPEWATIIWRNLLESAEFRNLLAARYSTYTGTVFSPLRTNAVLSEIVDERKPDIDKDFFRWNILGGTLGDFNAWDNKISNVRNFLNKRGEATLRHILEYYNITGDPIRPNLGLGLDNTGYTNISWKTNSTMGFFDISGAQIRPDLLGNEMASSFNANYIRGLPITVTANELGSNVFVHYKIKRGNSETAIFTDKTITFTPSNTDTSIDVKAVFKQSHETIAPETDSTSVPEISNSISEKQKPSTVIATTVNVTPTKIQLKKPTKLKFNLKAKKKVITWVGVKKNSGYTLTVMQRKKIIFKVHIKKNKTNYTFTKVQLKKFRKKKKYHVTLIAKGKGIYKNSKITKSKVVSIRK